MASTNAHAVWTGYLSFSMISIPVKAYAAARTEGVSFNQVHQCVHLEGDLKGQPTGTVTKINQQNFCSGCKTIVPYPQLSKGFEVSEGKYIVIDQKELDALAPTKSETIKVTEFVPMAEVDPIYFDKSYFVVAQGPGRLPYEMLFRTMGNTNLAGRAKLTMRGKSYNVLVRTYGNGLMIHTLFTAEEVRSLIEYNAKRDEVAVDETLLGQAKMLLTSMVKGFDPASLTDDYQAQVKALLDSKTATPGAEGTPGASAPKTTAADDLMASLTASLYQQGAPKTPPAAEPAKKTRAAKSAKVA